MADLTARLYSLVILPIFGDDRNGVCNAQRFCSGCHCCLMERKEQDWRLMFCLRPIVLLGTESLLCPFLPTRVKAVLTDANSPNLFLWSPNPHNNPFTHLSFFANANEKKRGCKTCGQANEREWMHLTSWSE